MRARPRHVWNLTPGERAIDFAEVVSAARDDLVSVLIHARQEGRTVAGYGGSRA